MKTTKNSTVPAITAARDKGARVTCPDKRRSPAGTGLTAQSSGTRPANVNAAPYLSQSPRVAP